MAEQGKIEMSPLFPFWRIEREFYSVSQVWCGFDPEMNSKWQNGLVGGCRFGDRFSAEHMLLRIGGGGRVVGCAGTVPLAEYDEAMQAARERDGV